MGTDTAGRWWTMTAMAVATELEHDAQLPDLDAEEAAATTDIVRAYLNGIGKTKLLTAEQEVLLAKRIEAGLYADELTRRAADGESDALDPAYAAELAIIVAEEIGRAHV